MNPPADRPPSDWATTIKPVASKAYLEISKTHGEQAGAAVEALEIARRRAEIEQTEADWRKRHGWDLERARGNYGHKDYLAGGNLLASAGSLFKSLCGEFGPQRAVHVLTGIEREHARASWKTDLRAWRGEKSVVAAAAILGLAVEDVEAIERGEFSAGPEAMRLVRPALRRVRADLGKTQP